MSLESYNAVASFALLPTVLYNLQTSGLRAASCYTAAVVIVVDDVIATSDLISDHASLTDVWLLTYIAAASSSNQHMMMMKAMFVHNVEVSIDV